jgi:endonuclease YncB( thermonuclease family)
MTGTAAMTATTTDGQSTIYTSTPLLHRYYRVVLHTAAGDTVKITKATLLIKGL